jgi:hypothetical protein
LLTSAAKYTRVYIIFCVDGWQGILKISVPQLKRLSPHYRTALPVKHKIYLAAAAKFSDIIF